MFSIEKPSSSRQKEKAPMERLTPLQEKESETASLRQRLDQLQRAITELEAENENLRAEKANREARIAALKAKDQIIQSLSNALNRREAEVDYYKQFTVKMENLENSILRSRDELSNQLEVVNARREIHKDTGPVPSAASEKANSHWFLHTGELEKFRERTKIAEVLNIGLAERHVVAPSATANLLSNPPYPLRSPLSMASRLEEETTTLPRSSTPRLLTLLARSWNIHQSEDVVSPAYSRTDEPVKGHSRVAAEPTREWVGSSDEEEEQKPDTSVQTDYEEATSQTRGKYWPRGVL